MAIVTPADYINVGGKVDVLVAVAPSAYVSPQWPFAAGRTVPGTTPANGPSAYAQLFKLGELEEEVEPRIQNLTGRVTGDRYGGAAGDGIETQYFGQAASVDLVMSRWDEEVWQLLKNNGGLSANTNNAILLSTIGALMQRDRSFRLLLYPNRDSRYIRNYPCCLIESDFSNPISTKYSRLQVRVTAHRTPEGHWSDPTNAAGTSTSIGVLENRDVTGMA